MPDFFGISDDVKTTSPPSGFEDVHEDGYSWAVEGTTYNTTTRIGAQDWNFLLAQFRGIMSGAGIDLSDLAVDSNFILREFITRYAAAISATVLYGSGAPDDGTVGDDGDFYIDTTAWEIYGPKVSDAWPAGVSLVGPQGPQGDPGADGDDGADGANGNGLLSGSGAPSGGTGADGDFYIDTAAWDIYGPKAGGAWPAGVSLVGPQGPQGDPGADGDDGADGADGNTVLHGAGAPDDGADGVDGDFYIDTSALEIYGPKAGGAWGAGSSLTADATGVNIQVFTASGTYTPTAGMTHCIIECIGGGGGGGGTSASSATTKAGGGGGGAGGRSIKRATAAEIGASKPVTIGAGGAGGTAGNNAGSAGGDTSVDTLCVAKGASGGGGGNGAGSGGNGGAGGVAGTGDVAATGASGEPSNNNGGLASPSDAGSSGGGGSSPFGGGAPGVRVAGAGGNATGYGSGGSGGATYNGSAAVAGGDASNGLIIITEYFT